MSVDLVMMWKHALNLHSSKEIDLWRRPHPVRTARTHMRCHVAPNRTLVSKHVLKTSAERDAARPHAANVHREINGRDFKSGNLDAARAAARRAAGGGEGGGAHQWRPSARKP